MSIKKLLRVLLVALLGFFAVNLAHATDPAIDLTPVTDGIGNARTAMIGIAAALIGSGIAVGAILWGSRFGKRLFNVFSK